VHESGPIHDVAGVTGPNQTSNDENEWVYAFDRVNCQDLGGKYT
jgi:hypothetical protein